MRRKSSFLLIPLGLLAISYLCDMSLLATGHAQLADVSFWLIATGVTAFAIGLAIARQHVLGGIGVLALFGASGVLRVDHHIPGTAPLVLSAVGVALALITMFGAELNRLDSLDGLRV